MSKGMLIPIVLLAVGLGVTLGSVPAAQGQSNLNDMDRHFMMEAARGGQAEVKLGQLAADHAFSPEVKRFGERMVRDHSRASDRLADVAAHENFTLPSDMGEKNQRVMDRLSNLSGREFDRAYMHEMIRDHTETVALFQREVRWGRDPEVKHFASRVLPTVQSHLRMANNIWQNHPAAFHRYRMGY